MWFTWPLHSYEQLEFVPMNFLCFIVLFVYNSFVDFARFFSLSLCFSYTPWLCATHMNGRIELNEEKSKIDQFFNRRLFRYSLVLFDSRKTLKSMVNWKFLCVRTNTKRSGTHNETMLKHTHTHNTNTHTLVLFLQHFLFVAVFFNRILFTDSFFRRSFVCLYRVHSTKKFFFFFCWNF